MYLHNLIKLRKEFENNPVIGYLNINHLDSKIEDPRDICSKSPIDILCIDETKLDSSYPDPQFKISSYQYPPYRREQHKYGGGEIVFLKEGLIEGRLRDFEGDTTDTICLKIIVSKRIWLIVFAYRPPINNVKDIFFSELSNPLNRAAMKYDNLLVIGNLNIDTLNKKKDNRNYFF